MIQEQTSAVLLGAPHHRQRAQRPRGARGGDPGAGRGRTWGRVLGSGQDDLGRARPGHRDRHRQIRAYRAQDRRDPRLDRRAGLLRPSGRGEPRRPRHGADRRRRAGHLLVGRDGGTGGDRHFRQALRHSVDRHDRRGQQHARPRGRRLPDDAERAGGLPQRARPDHLDDDAAGAGRRAGGRAARGPRLHRARLPRPSSGRQARGQARACAGSHAHRRPRAAHRRRAPGWPRRSSR